MSDEIQFGEVEHAEPEQALRPDQDAHFVTAEIGTLNPQELLIFVDLDVMRDMEAHAISNTRVELGGVMLGKQLVDDQGVPYVVITDSLRAEHYEATKGSFKFTHDTWSQITRQRDQFHPDLEMVGWYHTHPGWSVFLSGMDLFICNHFFNRPLDVALVIDPCEQDRGWFQWTDDQPPRTHRTAGFVLMTGRYRHDELQYFAKIYNKEPDMNLDPRYSSSPGGTTSVQVMDQRKSSLEIAVIGLLAMQFLFMMFVAWSLLAPPSSSKQVAELQAKIDRLEQRERTSIREQAQQDMLGSVVARLSGDESLADELVRLKENESVARINLEGQQALNDKLIAQRQQVVSDLAKSERIQAGLEQQLVTTKQKLKQSQARLDGIEARLGEDGMPIITPWYMWAAAALGILSLGGIGGYLLRRPDTADLDATGVEHESAGGATSRSARTSAAGRAPSHPETDGTHQEAMVFTDEQVDH